MERNRSDRKIKAPSGAAVPRAELTEALYRALFLEWADHGYSAMSLERVAARAGAGKAAIYRRWPTKLAFAQEAILALGVRLAHFEDTGSLEGDLQAFLHRLRTVLRHRLVRRILPDIHAEAVRSPDMKSIVARVASERREQAETVIRRAVDRGDLSGAMDHSLALDLLPSALYWRMIITKEPMSTEQVGKQASALAAALRAL